MKNGLKSNTDALYFMPDISGFSRFVGTTEIEHSLHIIQELMQILMQENHIDLNLVEVEGDALFFYRDQIPGYEALLEQISRMLWAFHTHLSKYEHSRICECGACTSAIDLKLKFIVHTGPLHFIEVASSKKPFGPDVNFIHRLLKNEVPGAQYLLFSQSTYSFYVKDQELEFCEAESSYDIGRVNYYYRNLETPHIIDIPYEFAAHLSKAQEGLYPTFEISRNLPCSVEVLFDWVSNLDKRNQWDDVPDELIYEAGKLNRAGTIHQCIIGSNTLQFETGKMEKSSTQERIYTEQTIDMPYVSHYRYAIHMEPLPLGGSRLVLRTYLKAGILGQILLRLFLKRQMKEHWERKLDALLRLCS